MKSTEFIDRSNMMARINAMKDTCIKCKGPNNTGYTMCEECASKVEKCIECKMPMTEAQVKFSKSVYGKLLCWADQPAQKRAREMAREVKK